jgi:formylglycine-generating enzyme
MGCNDSDSGSAEYDGSCSSYESPQHLVTTSAYCIDVTEVTNGAYAPFLTEHGNACATYECVDSDALSLQLEESAGTWSVKMGKEHRPVVEVTWYGAVDYCLWAGGRLCSEAEWEKAARGGCEKTPGDCRTSTRKYPWGSEPATCDYAVMNEGGGWGCGTGGSLDVGSKSLGDSPYGVKDMAGNVWEWQEDDWHGSYTDAPDDGSAWVEDPRGSTRVYRGGSWSHFADGMRASFRSAVSLYDSYDVVGLRCCRSLD